MIPGLGRYPGEGKGYPLQYFGLENSMTVFHAKSRTRLRDFHLDVQNSFFRDPSSYRHSQDKISGKSIQTYNSSIKMCIYIKVTQENWASQVALVVKNPPANAGDARDACSILGLGRSPGVGNGNLLQYSYLENSMDRGTWLATVHGVAKSQTQLSTHTEQRKSYLLQFPITHKIKYRSHF